MLLFVHDPHVTHTVQVDMHTAKVGCASGSTMPTAATMQQQATPQHGPARPLQAVATTAAARPSPATCLRPDVESIYSTSAVAEPVPPFPGQQPPLTQDVPMYENTVEDDFVERFLKLDNVQLNQLRLEAHQHPLFNTYMDEIRLDAMGCGSPAGSEEDHIFSEDPEKLVDDLAWFHGWLARRDTDKQLEASQNASMLEAPTLQLNLVTPPKPQPELSSGLQAPLPPQPEASAAQPKPREHTQPEAPTPRQPEASANLPKPSEHAQPGASAREHSQPEASAPRQPKAPAPPTREHAQPEASACEHTQPETRHPEASAPRQVEASAPQPKREHAQPEASAKPIPMEVEGAVEPPPLPKQLPPSPAPKPFAAAEPKAKLAPVAAKATAGTEIEFQPVTAQGMQAFWNVMRRKSTDDLSMSSTPAKVVLPPCPVPQILPCEIVAAMGETEPQPPVSLPQPVTPPVPPTPAPTVLETPATSTPTPAPNTAVQPGQHSVPPAPTAAAPSITLAQAPSTAVQPDQHSEPLAVADRASYMRFYRSGRSSKAPPEVSKNLGFKCMFMYIVYLCCNMHIRHLRALFGEVLLVVQPCMVVLYDRVMLANMSLGVLVRKNHRYFFLTCRVCGLQLFRYTNTYTHMRILTCTDALT